MTLNCPHINFWHGLDLGSQIGAVGESINITNQSRYSSPSNFTSLSEANIISAKKIMHGKISPVIHNNSRMYTDISNPFNATRYHSLVIEKPSLPNCLNITAWTEEDNDIEIMGIEHKEYPTYGLQFHPESILTTSGHQLLKNFLEI